MKKTKIYLAIIIIILIALGVACSKQNTNDGGNDLPEDNSGSPNPTATLTTAANTLPPDNTSESNELPPLSFEEIFEAGIEAGDWTEGEGLVHFMKYFVGEGSGEGISGSSEVIESDGTGIVKLVRNYLNEPDIDPDTRAELERVLRMLFPPQDVLDAISRSEVAQNAAGRKLASIHPSPLGQDGNPADCNELIQNGFDPSELGITCYIYNEREVEGHRLRVYYPVAWVLNNEDEKLLSVIHTMDALETSVGYYHFIPNLTVPNINVVFSLLPDSEVPTSTGGMDWPTDEVEACPTLLFPEAFQQYSGDQYKQLVANLAAFCVFQETFAAEPWGNQEWWFKGAAVYLSNLPYPFANREYRSLPNFDQRSINTPINQMSYENFVFFQFLGNEFGEDGVVDILHQLSDAGGDISILSNIEFMEDRFNEFVVRFLSSGILDTNQRDYIKTSLPPAVTNVKTIDDKGIQKFPAEPFTAVRYYVDYQKEKRFLQTRAPNVTVGGRFSGVELELHQDINFWSNLPPEIRSSCDDDVRYLFVTTTTKHDTFDYQVEVTEAQKASCDPCLLGVWAVDNDTFENYFTSLMEAEGIDPLQDISELGEFTFEITGQYLIGFGENGKLAAWRNGLTITVGAGGFKADTILDSYGTGTYSADGEKLTIYYLTDLVTSQRILIGGVAVQMEDAAGVPSYSMFTRSYEPEPSGKSTVSSGAESYFCEEDILAIDMPSYGALQFDRVEQIIPTPVPTPDLSGN